MKIYPNETRIHSSRPEKPTQDSKNIDQQENEKLETKTKPNLIVKDTLTMDKADLERIGIRGCRLSLAMLLRSKTYDVLMILLIILYTLLIFVYFAFDCQYFEDNPDDEKIFLYVEIAILSIFSIEILLSIVALHKLYLQDPWNVFDLFIIIVSITFVLLDVFISTNQSLKQFLKIRGIFRLLRIFILIRKLNALRVKRENQKRKKFNLGYNLVAPQEKVISILTDLRNQINLQEDKVLEDLNYCIKMIQSGTIYDAKIDLEGGDGKEADQQVRNLLDYYSNTQKKTPNSYIAKRASKIHGNLSVPPFSPLLRSNFDTIGPEQIKQIYALNEEASNEMGKIGSLDFDIFKLKDLVEDKELTLITSYILAKHNIFNMINYETFKKYMILISKGYKEITYHNKTHSADLCQTFYYFLTTCELYQKAQFEEEELFSVIVAGAIHDYEHPGVTSPYLVEIQDKWAIQHNDQSVLENHHLASAFQVMKKNNCDIFSQLQKDEFKRCRKLIIDCVLGTDMAKHMNELGKFKAKVASQDFDPSSDRDKNETIVMLFHLADISNSTKPWSICHNWIERLFIEFFHQGDIERSKGHNISYLMDRTTVCIARSQIGFLDFIILPSYSAAKEVLPELEQNIQNAVKNKEEWTKRFDEYDQRMEQEKNKIRKSLQF